MLPLGYPRSQVTSFVHSQVIRSQTCIVAVALPLASFVPIWISIR